MAERYELTSLDARELVPGHHGRFIHSIEAGAVLPEHSHPHEQIVNVLEGTYELVVAGETFVVHAGEVLVIPGDAVHSGQAHTDCRILDVFSPLREEYR
jgi:quercetin dioxygenase-like cupin family protein